MFYYNRLTGNEIQKVVGWEERAWIYFPKIIHQYWSVAMVTGQYR